MAHPERKNKRDTKTLVGVLTIGLALVAFRNPESTRRVVTYFQGKQVSCFSERTVDMVVADGVNAPVESLGNQEIITNVIAAVNQGEAVRVGIIDQPSWGEEDRREVISQIKTQTFLDDRRIIMLPAAKGSTDKVEILAGLSTKYKISSLAPASSDRRHQGYLVHMLCNHDVKATQLKLQTSSDEPNMTKDLEMIFSLYDSRGIFVGIIKSLIPF